MKIYCVYAEGLLTRVFSTIQKAESWVGNSGGESYLEIIELSVE